MARGDMGLQGDTRGDAGMKNGADCHHSYVATDGVLRCRPSKQAAKCSPARASACPSFEPKGEEIQRDVCGWILGAAVA